MDEPVTVICWKWNVGKHVKKGITYDHRYVNELYRMLEARCSVPFRLVCITDDPEGIHGDVETRPIWPDLLHAGGCWVRLRSFSDEMRDFLGCERFVSLDLDCAIIDDPAPLFTRTEDFIIYCEPTRRTPYCGAMYAMDVGSRQQVIDEFDLAQYPPTGDGPRWSLGTDQFHITRMLYPNEVTWGTADGLYNFATSIIKREHCSLFMRRRSPNMTPEYITAKKLAGRMIAEVRARDEQSTVPFPRTKGRLPENARIIFFNGRFDPADLVIQTMYPWIKEHYGWVR